jgi:hypothetical protein
MTRGLSHFRQGDLARAVRALKTAGVKIDRVEIGADGKLAVFVKQNGGNAKVESNPWDEILNDGAHQTRIRANDP